MLQCVCICSREQGRYVKAGRFCGCCTSSTGKPHLAGTNKAGTSCITLYWPSCLMLSAGLAQHCSFGPLAQTIVDCPADDQAWGMNVRFRLMLYALVCTASFMPSDHATFAFTTRHSICIVCHNQVVATEVVGCKPPPHMTPSDKPVCEAGSLTTFKCIHICRSAAFCRIQLMTLKHHPCVWRLLRSGSKLPSKQRYQNLKEARQMDPPSNPHESSMQAPDILQELP